MPNSLLHHNCSYVGLNSRYFTFLYTTSRRTVKNDVITLLSHTVTFLPYEVRKVW
jgi:hypothetical protein